VTEEEKYVRLTNLLLLQFMRNGATIIESVGNGDHEGLSLVVRLLDKMIDNETARIDGGGNGVKHELD
jgi:hypothetical protein